MNSVSLWVYRKRDNYIHFLKDNEDMAKLKYQKLCDIYLF